MTLDEARAARAIEDHVARPLGLSVEQAAIGILRLLEQNLLHAVERLSVERGYDPKRFTLVAAGVRDRCMGWRSPARSAANGSSCRCRPGPSVRWGCSGRTCGWICSG